MPSLSPTMEMGTIVKWHKREGDPIVPGDILCDIQTDKAVVGMEYEDEGVLAKILKPENSKDIKVGEMIAVMVDQGEDWTDVAVPTDDFEAKPYDPEKYLIAKPEGQADRAGAEGAAAPPPPPASAPAKPPEPPSEPPPPKKPLMPIEPKEEWHLVGPSVRKLLEEYSIKVEEIKRTGPRGSMTKQDVLDYINEHKLTKWVVRVPPPKMPEPDVDTAKLKYIDVPISNMQYTIAHRLIEAKTLIPHSYAAIECRMGNVTNLAKKLTAEGTKVVVQDFIIKAAGYALDKEPKLNNYWGEDGQPHVNNTVDIAVAVLTEQGFLTPIVPNVVNLGVSQISSLVRVLSERAIAGKLAAHEHFGGTFTIQDLGYLGVKEFAAVIIPPQVAILGIGLTQIDMCENSILEPKMMANLSFDNRALNETDAARFLETFRSALENPEIIMAGTSDSKRQLLAS